MDLNEITRGLTIPIGILMIVIFYLVSGTSSSILPYVFITCILVGFLKNETVTDSAVATLITSIIGSVIATAIYLVIVYFSYGSVYLSYTLYSSAYTIVLYVIGGVVGGVIGYYISKEFEEKYMLE